MGQENDKIKKIFSSKLSGYQPDTPVDMWERIGHTLNHAEKRTTPIIMMKRIASLAASVAAMLVLGFLLLNKENDIAKQLTLDNPVRIHPSLNIEKPYLSEENSNNYSSHPSVKPAGIAANYLYTHTLNVEKTISASDLNNIINDEITDYEIELYYNLDSQTSSETGSDKYADSQQDIEEKIRAYSMLGQYSNTPFIAIDHQDERKGFSLSVEGQSSFTKQNNSGTPVPDIFLKHASMDNSDPALSSHPNSQASRRKKLIKMEHKQPISFGLKVSKGINNHLSVETGVVYTYLSSKIKSARPTEVTLDGTQKFHYLGVPVLLNYTFAKWDKVEFHVAGGGMIQKDISGKIEGNQEIKDLYEEEVNTTKTFQGKISQDNLQFSLLANAGVSYPIYDKLNAYATIGGAYYFDANNEHPTIYSDKKIQLDLNVGLKIKF